MKGRGQKFAKRLCFTSLKRREEGNRHRARTLIRKNGGRKSGSVKGTASQRKILALEGGVKESVGGRQDYVKKRSGVGVLCNLMKGQVLVQAAG